MSFFIILHLHVFLFLMKQESAEPLTSVSSFCCLAGEVNSTGPAATYCLATSPGKLSNIFPPSPPLR